eukprot:8540637-Alexandrium_andersonii.AAC.1
MSSIKPTFAKRPLAPSASRPTRIGGTSFGRAHASGSVGLPFRSLELRGEPSPSCWPTPECRLPFAWALAPLSGGRRGRSSRTSGGGAAPLLRSG